MNRRVIALIVVLGLAGLALAAYFLWFAHPAPLKLTGLVTTHDVIVSPQVPGQVERLLVAEGDAVKQGQLLVVIKPDELKADTEYYSHSAEQIAAQVKEGEAALRYQQSVTT